MRMAELSRESGVAIATIKYYQREGLLPPGALTSPNQARYGPAHVRRLRLVRALTEVGGLSVADVRDVLAAIDEPRTPLHDVVRGTQLCERRYIGGGHSVGGFRVGGQTFEGPFVSDRPVGAQDPGQGLDQRGARWWLPATFGRHLLDSLSGPFPIGVAGDLGGRAR